MSGIKSFQIPTQETNFKISSTQLMDAPFRDPLPTGTSGCDTMPSINGGNHTYHESRIIYANAPSEARNSIIASATSRKEVLVRFAKPVVPAKSRESSANDEAGELMDDSSAPSIDPNVVVEQIKSDRRRRKAISARKSRQRRLEQMEELEKERNDLLKVVHV